VAKAIVFDLFHTLTAPDTEWTDLPMTSDALGIPRDAWYQALTQNSRQRLTGEISDPVEIVRLVAHSINPHISEQQIARAAGFRKERFNRMLTAIPQSTLEVVGELGRRGRRLALISNCDASEVAAWEACPLRGLFDVEVFSCHVSCRAVRSRAG
jgi:putative hydrolase of the HAD superfamily